VLIAVKAVVKKVALQKEALNNLFHSQEREQVDVERRSNFKSKKYNLFKSY
jgi:hypothetical protein